MLQAPTEVSGRASRQSCEGGPPSLRGRYALHNTGVSHVVLSLRSLRGSLIRVLGLGLRVLYVGL